MTDSRPDPDRLLAQLKDEELQAARGKLKLFFGASAGVGKTYAMLSAARVQQQQGVDVVIGVIETHGRAETQALLAGLPAIALKEVRYRDRVLKTPLGSPVAPCDFRQTSACRTANCFPAS